MKSIVVRAHGGPAVLEWIDVPTRRAGPGQVLVRHEAIGVNFVDVHHRRGEPYPMSVPFTPGIQAAGVVEAVGARVRRFAPGDRVAYTGAMGTVYAESGAWSTGSGRCTCRMDSPASLRPRCCYTG